MKKVLALDVSGQFNEGKGTTGWCVAQKTKNGISLKQLGAISAETYTNAEEYFDAHLKLIDIWMQKGVSKIIVEDYLLYPSKAQAQSLSRMETSQLIGVIKQHCYKNHFKLVLQTAATVKNRWTDEILTHKNVPLPIGKHSNHIKDAIRHAVHDLTFKED